MNNSEMTIRAVIDSILERVPEKVGPGTVDSLKIGNAAQPVRGIVVTLMATRAVLQQAVDLGANFIVTHEPTFYHHLDATDWLETDSVSFAKKKWIEEHDLTIWRFHDGPHQLEPDGIDVGMALKLGWTADPARRKIFTVSSKTARDLAESCKQLLGISHVRVAGDLEAPCTRVGLRAGASGGQLQIDLFRLHDADVVVCGESPEWETCEYVRDAVAIGKKKALIVLGHANSEEGGMEWIATWLRSFLPTAIPLHFIPAEDPFRFI